MIIAFFEVAFGFVDTVFLVRVGESPYTPCGQPSIISSLPLFQPPHWSSWVQIDNQTTKILEPTSTHIIPCLELFH